MMKKFYKATVGTAVAGRVILFMAAGFAFAGTARAQRMAASDGYYLVADTLRGADSVRMVELQEVQVVSTRASQKTPVAFAEIDRTTIERVNNGVDLPFLLQSTPSVVVTSDAGAGVGYTSVRIRGTDATRINVTANGIPINDAESHSVFWVNMPDFVASVEDIQVQRGVGTSTNGAGAFGGSINLKTEALTPKPFASFSGSYGSYNTHRESVDVGTGLLGGHWAFNARLSNIGSDGYVDHASTELKSYFFQVGFYARNTTVKFINFAGREKTYHAWDGIDRTQMMENRRYNPCGEMWLPLFGNDGKPVFDEKGKLQTYYAGHYKDQTDNYNQKNYQLLVTQRLSDRFDLNINLHYTDGYGYYEQYKNAQKLVQYGLKPFLSADLNKEPYYNSNGEVDRSNLIRRKIMDNWFAGGVFSVNYNAPRLNASFGGAANKYDGDHYGRVIWVQNYAADPTFNYDHEYYNNVGKKTDVNFYLKANWMAAKGLYLYGDVQFRHINYKINGTNDNYQNATIGMQPLDVDDNFNFFNPKAGLFYDFGKWSVYGSVAVAHKEPTRNNYTDAKENQVPKSERLTDYELGGSFRSGIFSAGINLYYMDYKDQLVLTGELNHIGEPLADNVKDSYRMGVELTAGAQITEWLRWDVNATFSRNKIKGYTEHVYGYDDNGNQFDMPTYLGTTDIAYSPKVLVGSTISFSYKGFGAILQTNLVGSQWVTNAASKLTYSPGEDNERLKLRSYFVNNLRVDYTFKLRTLKLLNVGVTVNNIFNEKYCSNGWGGSYLDGNSTDGYYRVNYMGFYPQATTNVLASIMLKF